MTSTYLHRYRGSADDSAVKIASYLMPRWEDYEPADKKLLLALSIAPWITKHQYELAQRSLRQPGRAALQAWLEHVAPHIELEECWRQSHRMTRAVRSSIWGLADQDLLTQLLAPLTSLADALLQSEDFETASLGLFYGHLLRLPESEVAFERALLEAMRARPPGAIELRILLEAVRDLEESNAISSRLRSAGRFFALWGQADRGATQFLKTLEALESDRSLSKELKAYALLYRSSLELRKMRAKDAAAHAEAAREDFVALELSSGEAEATLLLARAHFRLGDGDKAREFAEAARRLTAGRAPAVALSAGRLLAEVDLWEGENDKAIRRLERMLPAVSDTGSAKLQAETQLQLGKGLAESGRYSEAQKHLKDALSYFELTNDTLGHANVSLVYGSTLMSSVGPAQRSANAREKLRAAETAIRRAVQLSHGIAQTTHTYAQALLGRLLIKRATQFSERTFDEAKEQLDAALSAFEEAGDDDGVALVAGDLASLYTEFGHWMHAAKALNQAAVAASGLDDEDTLVSLRAKAAHLLDSVEDKSVRSRILNQVDELMQEDDAD